jgi:hypothetical protein
MDLSFFSDIRFFKGGAFRLIVALASAALGVWIKSEMRHPDKQKFKWEDFAVGIQLMQTACVSFLTLMTQKAVQLNTVVTANLAAPNGPTDAQRLSTFLAFSSVQLAFMLIFLFGITSMVRRKGWKTPNEMNVKGIAIPFAAGLICLYAVIQEAQ